MPVVAPDTARNEDRPTSPSCQGEIYARRCSLRRTRSEVFDNRTVLSTKAFVGSSPRAAGARFGYGPCGPSSAWLPSSPAPPCRRPGLQGLQMQRSRAQRGATSAPTEGGWETGADGRESRPRSRRRSTLSRRLRPRPSCPHSEITPDSGSGFYWCNCWRTPWFMDEALRLRYASVTLRLRLRYACATALPPLLRLSLPPTPPFPIHLSPLFNLTALQTSEQQRLSYRVWESGA